MNRSALSFLNIVHYPIWLKIALLVTIGMLALALPAFLTVRTATLESGYESAERYLQTSGTQHVASVRSVIADAQALLNAFMESVGQGQQLETLIARDDDPSLLDFEDPDFIGRLLSRGLLEEATSPFEHVRLVSTTGNIGISVSLNTSRPQDQPGVSQNQNATYQAAEAAAVIGANETIAAWANDDGYTIELVQIIRHVTTDEVVAYLIARVNPQRIENALLTEDTGYREFLQLVNPAGIVYAPGSDAANPSTADLATGAERALAGETGLERYAQPRGERVIGYYAPIGFANLGLVSEIPVSAVEAQAFSYFTTRAFVLTIGFVALASVMVILLSLLNNLITPPLGRLRKATQALGMGNFSEPVPDTRRDDEIGALATSFVMMRDQVQSLIGDLQTRLEARLRDIDTTQEISRFAAMQSDVQSLLDRVVTLIAQRFPNIYHAQIFLLDNERKNAVLRASTGEAGRKLLERGHRLAVGSVSVIGQTTEQRRLVVARDTAYSPMHRQNDLLPDTRAELAIPLFFGDNLIGVLDLQSKERDAFTPEQINVLQTVANQVAVAIQTARLYEESVQRLERIEQANRAATLRAWQDYMRDQRVRDMRSEAGVIVDSDVSLLRRTALTTGQPAIGDVTPRATIPVAVPIQIGGQTIGSVEWEVPASDFGEDRLELARELARRLALSLDNARLFQESRRAAERERLVNNIAARLTAQTDVNEILQTAVREVGQALQSPQVSIRLHGKPVVDTGSATNGTHSNGHHAN
jgi:GAF domain-containing protein/HAMP domain-containing protein